MEARDWTSWTRRIAVIHHEARLRIPSRELQGRFEDWRARYHQDQGPHHSLEDLTDIKRQAGMDAKKGGTMGRSGPFSRTYSTAGQCWVRRQRVSSLEPMTDNTKVRGQEPKRPARWTKAGNSMACCWPKGSAEQGDAHTVSRGPGTTSRHNAGRSLRPWLAMSRSSWIDEQCRPGIVMHLHARGKNHFRIFLRTGESLPTSRKRSNDADP